MHTEKSPPSDVLREFIADIRAAYASRDGDGLDRDRLTDEWPDLLVTFDKAISCLEEQGIPIGGDADQEIESVIPANDSGTSEKRPILVVVEGGVVQDVSNLPPGIAVVVRDYDVQPNDDPDYPRDHGGHPFAESTWRGDLEPDALNHRDPTFPSRRTH
jgi:hypothetical protein